MLSPRPSRSAAPSIWYAAVPAPQRKPSGKDWSSWAVPSLMPCTSLSPQPDSRPLPEVVPEPGKQITHRAWMRTRGGPVEVVVWKNRFIETPRTSFLSSELDERDHEHREPAGAPDDDQGHRRAGRRLEGRCLVRA